MYLSIVYSLSAYALHYFICFGVHFVTYLNIQLSLNHIGFEYLATT